MTLKASLVITGDAASATAALGQLDDGLKGNEQAATQAANAWRNADQAIKQLANAQAAAKRETDQTKAAFAAGEITLEQYNRELLETKSALSLVAAQHQSAMTALRASSRVMEGGTVSTRQQAAAYTNLGRQAQDVAVQLQMGTNIGTIVAQQGTQVADAVAMMGGRFAGLASFMAGPFGTAIIVGAGVLLNQLVPALFQASDAAEENAAALAGVQNASDGVSSAQSVLAGMFDMTTGAIDKQNGMLRANIALMAAKLRAEAVTAQEAAREGVEQAGQASWSRRLAGALYRGPAGPVTSNRTVARSKIEDVMAGKLDPSQAIKWAEGADFSGVAIDRAGFMDAILRAAEVGPKNATADAIDRSLDAGKLDAMFLKPDKPNRPRAARKGPDIAEFGEDTAAKIARIVDQFSDLPPVVARSNDAMRQLDDVASDLEKKKGPRYEELVGKLVAARDVIQASLTKPLDDYLEKAGQTAAIDKLILAGKRDQAVALQDALALQRQMGPLTQEQLATILETVVAERERGELLQRQQEMIGNYLDSTRSVRGEINAILSGTGKLSSLPEIYKNLQGKVLGEKLFGPMFRELDKWVQDNSGLKDATTAYVDSTKDTGAAATELAAAFRAAGGQIKTAGSRANSPSGSTFDEAFAGFAGAKTSTAQKGTVAANKNTAGIVVTAQLPKKPGSLLDVTIDEYMRRMTGGIAEELTDALNGAFGTQFFSKLTGSLAGAMQGYMVSGGSPFGAALGALKELPGLPQGIADKLGGAFKGMATGAQVAGLANAFGIKMSNTGAQVGGVIGSFFGPAGSIIGSVAGGLVEKIPILGGLLGVLGFGGAKDGNLGVSGLSGRTQSRSNSGQISDNLSGIASELTGNIAAIAKALGATVGDFSVSLGQRNDYFRVGADASFDAGSKYARGSLYDGKDPAAALAVALKDALSDGAIQGISNAVRKALSSSANIDDAVAEALKVQELEELLGGVTGEAEKAFATFERQAKERLRIATAYGFDVVKIEELNAKERLKLSKDLLDRQVGSLQRLIDEMTGGSLFEGSAVDRRAALLEQIGKAKSDTDAGVDGAADQLARLLEQLNAVSKEVYGTTGGFAADRGAILDQARDAIARANQRITEAQTKSDPALAQTNAALDENNDQNAKIIALLQSLGGGGGRPPAAGDSYSRLARLAATQAY